MDKKFSELKLEQLQAIVGGVSVNVSMTASVIPKQLPVVTTSPALWRY